MDPQMVCHRQAIRGCRAICRWPGSAVGLERKEATADYEQHQERFLSGSKRDVLGNTARGDLSLIAHSQRPGPRRRCGV